jgi:SAM-dependent methyltransferase
MSLRSKLVLAGSAFGLGAGAATAGLKARQPLAPLVPAPPAPGPSSHEVIVDAITETLTSRAEPAWHAPMPVSEELYSRLLPEDLEQLTAMLEGSPLELWEMTNEHGKQRLAVVLTAFYEIAPALERMKLTSAEPPDEVHAMARGPLAAGGDPSIADLVISTLDQAGLELAKGATILDFGCSSGRVLRAIAAYRDDLDCVGCDPNAGAIEWAQQHLPMARFFVSPGAPPLHADAESVDAAYAISIWSHFAEPQALAWLEEMHRVIRPGGALLLTTHGLDTLGTFLRRGDMSRDSASEVALKLLSHGHHWYDVFGEEGDWGVKDTGWGNGYMSLDWLAAHVTPQWSLRLFSPGGIDQNQDVIVLERR